MLSPTWAQYPPWADSLRAYATAHKTVADPPTVSRCNGASCNRVPTNTSKKSGGSKRSGTRHFSDKRDKRELIFAEDGQQYARVTKRFGDGRFEVLCLGDGQPRLGHVRGKLWKRVWIAPADLVLVSQRTYQDQKVDVVHKYTSDEERELARFKEVPEAAFHSQHDEDYERGLQAERDIHGAARVGFIPGDDCFGFDEDA